MTRGRARQQSDFGMRVGLANEMQGWNCYLKITQSTGAIDDDIHSLRVRLHGLLRFDEMSGILI